MIDLYCLKSKVIGFFDLSFSGWLKRREVNE